MEEGRGGEGSAEEDKYTERKTDGRCPFPQISQVIIPCSLGIAPVSGRDCNPVAPNGLVVQTNISVHLTRCCIDIEVCQKWKGLERKGGGRWEAGGEEERGGRRGGGRGEGGDGRRGRGRGEEREGGGEEERRRGGEERSWEVANCSKLHFMLQSDWSFQSCNNKVHNILVQMAGPFLLQTRR